MTIKIKIQQTDKRIMLKCLDMIEKPCPIETIHEMLVYETIMSIKSKLMNTLHNDKLTLTLAETNAFVHFLKAYEIVGTYEAANALLLREEIEKKLRAKFLIFNS